MHSSTPSQQVFFRPTMHDAEPVVLAAPGCKTACTDSAAHVSRALQAFLVLTILPPLVKHEKPMCLHMCIFSEVPRTVCVWRILALCGTFCVKVATIAQQHSLRQLPWRVKLRKHTPKEAPSGSRLRYRFGFKFLPFPLLIIYDHSSSTVAH